MYNYSAGAGVSSGFQGCITQLELGGRLVDMQGEVEDSQGVEDCAAFTNSGCREGDCTKTTRNKKTLCERLYPCQGGASCQGNVTHFQCFCPWGRQGKNCEESKINAFNLNIFTDCNL